VHQVSNQHYDALNGTSFINGTRVSAGDGDGCLSQAIRMGNFKLIVRLALSISRRALRTPPAAGLQADAVAAVAAGWQSGRPPLCDVAGAGYRGARLRQQRRRAARSRDGPLPRAERPHGGVPHGNRRLAL
jgi:hypothetical protein